MRKNLLTIALLLGGTLGISAQRTTDKLDRGLIAQKIASGTFLSWRVLGEEYYDVKYNVYRDGTKITDEPISVSNYKDAGGSLSSTYTIAPVVRGKEQAQSKPAKVWSKGYMEINPKHDASLRSTYVPNDACCCDVDGDGELEILLKYDNADEIGQSYPKYGPKINGVDTKEHTLLECLKLDGTVLWWINTGPNMGDFQNNEINIVGYDWDGDGKAEVVLRAADGTTIHKADGSTYVVGNASLNYRGATGGGTNWFMCQGAEYLLYLNGETGAPYQCLTYPLARLEDGQGDLNAQWGDGYGHRSSKYFFGAPYLDGRKPSIFLARGIYTRHKMIAYDVDPASHRLVQRWKWYNNTNGPWKGQGYHNYAIADVDMDGRDEIVFGSMVIDDNGKGLSTTGYGHGDAQHCGDLNPYVHGLEQFACNEDAQGFNYRDATTSKIYAASLGVGKDVGRAMAGNFTNDFPGGMGTAWGDPISTVTNKPVPGLISTGVNSNFRIYWDGDLLEETFNYQNGKNTAGVVAKYGSWDPIYVCDGSMTNNDTKGTPCYQGDVFGDWREEIIMRTANNRIRIYSTPTPTKYRNYTLWHDHQYRNAMVWQMCGYNQPPHVSYFLGELENITVAPPPLTMTDREEVANGGVIGCALNDKHVIVCETGNTNVSIEEGAKPYILTFNVPTWVQGTAASESSTKDTRINTTTYTCTVTGGGITGDARIVKQGDGVLTLPKAAFTHTGETNVWEGTLNFDGTMPNSPLWLNRFTTLNSDGGVFKSLKADYASTICPGAADKKGTITATDEIKLGFGSRVVLDLFGETLDGDMLKTKTLSVEHKTGDQWLKYGPEYTQPVIQIVGHNLVAGDYVIAEADSIDGSVANIKVEGVLEFKTGLRHEDGKVILTLGDTRGAAEIYWTGANGNVWDFANTQNFALVGDTLANPEMFVKGDEVLFNDDASVFSVNINEALNVDGITVNNTKAYTFQGEGYINSGKLTKDGRGTLTMKTMNKYTGGNHIMGGTVVVSQLANDIDATGNLGGVTKTADLFTIGNGASLQANAAVKNGSPIRFVGEEGGVINNANDFTQQKPFSGTLLTKKGAGCLHTEVANTSLTMLALNAGSIAVKGSPAATVQLNAGTIWDDAQSTNFAIEVPKGKSGTLQLTTAYYTAYANRLTGEGTITIVPRNTVSRVRITGDWSRFEGTVKHTTKDIWLPLDMTSGMPHGTLDIADGCSVTNVAKAVTFGAVTGKGNLCHPVANFQNSSAVSGTNTWKIGNSDDHDFKFDGKIHDEGGTNKSNFEKVGTCKMTVSGASDHTGTSKVTAGTLQLTSTALLGKGAFTLSAGATLAGVSKELTNSSFTMNGTVQPGSLVNSTTGVIDFGGKNVTFGTNSILSLNLRNAGGTKLAGTSIQNIGTLTFNGTLNLRFPSSTYKVNALSVGDAYLLWTGITTVKGTPKIAPTEDDVDGWHYVVTFDTSRLLAEGIVTVASIEKTPIANGDVNGDGTVGIDDITALIDLYLSEGYSPAADFDGDGTTSIDDITSLIDLYLSAE